MKIKGFTLIELLVVVAIIAILAAILFPVFARAREKANQTTCTSNQRQIATAINMYTQDHEEMLPATATVWTDIQIHKEMLSCPSDDAKELRNGYGYNAFVGSGNIGNGGAKSLGDFDNPQEIVLTCDAVPVPPMSSANILASAKDCKTRHSSKMIASYLDGHVDVLTSLPARAFGITALTFSDISFAALTLDSSKFSATSPTPVLTLPSSVTGLKLTKLGSNGYNVYNWLTNAGDEQNNNSWATSNLAPTGMRFGVTLISAEWIQAQYWGGLCFDDTSLGNTGIEMYKSTDTNRNTAGVMTAASARNAGIGPSATMSTTGSKVSITVPAGDYNTHILTIFGMTQNGSPAHNVRYQVAPMTGFDDFSPEQFYYKGNNSPILQFRFSGNIAMRVVPASGVRDNDKAWLKAIFID